MPVSLLLIVLVGLGWVALRRSRLGTSIVALGSDADAAAYTGVAVGRTRILAFALAVLAVQDGARVLIIPANSTAHATKIADTPTDVQNTDPSFPVAWGCLSLRSEPESGPA